MCCSTSATILPGPGRCARLYRDLDEGQPLTLVFGCLKDKPVAELAQILFPLFRHVVVTPVDSPRSAPVEELLAAARPTGSEARRPLTR